ncbi:hypothetical protein [Kitasatospora sp. NPDC002965]|uniref:hypothetical protein n=1 Tax=Kitasatospora sp. NPDC002965 TaxID=3154775 RepID=UPI0033A34256
MSWAISRDEQIAALYQRLQHRSAILAGLTPGTPSHTGIQAECDAIHAEIRRLETSRSISPKALLLVVGITALLLWSLLTSGR